MKLSNQLFRDLMKMPDDYSNKLTSSLLESGIFTFFKDPGVPFYLPIGMKILQNMQKVFLEEAEKLSFDFIDIPWVVKNEVLEKGDIMEKTFEEKTMHLENRAMRGYHILTTPEPMMLNLATQSSLSHNQLPIHLVYNVEIVRGIKDPKGLLKGRQFKTFMGIR